MNYIQQFIDSRKNPNTAKAVKYVLKNVSVDIEMLPLEELRTFVLGLCPRSPKEITTICYALNSYARWLHEQNLVVNNPLLRNIQLLDKKQLWKDAKPKAEKKFISYVQYRSILHDISLYEEYNPLYYESLFASIFEGIYSDSLDVLKNLRGSDIDGTIVTLREDTGHTYKLRISEELSQKLQELAQNDIWRRPNRYGICKVSMTGLHTDTVFKVEKRTTSTKDAQRFPYYDRLRKIKDEYVGYNLSPLDLYTSGIVHRIQGKLKRYGISLEEAFAANCRNRIAYTIITNELARCNGIIEVSNFRELVKGHIDVFSDDNTDDVSNNLFEEINVDEPSEEYHEGEEFLKTHLSHERNTEVVALAKDQFKSTHSGRLFCEKCGFDFAERYGERGTDFIEVHHIKPLSMRQRNESTKVEDLVLLCSNCHSIVHRKQPWLSMTELEDILNNNKKRDVCHN